MITVPLNWESEMEIGLARWKKTGLMSFLRIPVGKGRISRFAVDLEKAVEDRQLSHMHQLFKRLWGESDPRNQRGGKSQEGT